MHRPTADFLQYPADNPATRHRAGVEDEFIAHLTAPSSGKPKAEISFLAKTHPVSILRQVLGEALESACPAALMQIARRDRLEDGLM
jgi:hypothetical protein